MSEGTIGPGTVLAGRFTLEDLLDESSGALFWRATDQVLARSVAVHVLPDTDPRATALLGGARSSALVSDPRLLRVLDAAATDGMVYVVNEWGSGVSLDRLLAEGALSPRRAAWLVQEVADAIAVAHRNGVAHGRLLPENVMISEAGSVKVIGFVVDAVLRSPSGQRLATDGTPLTARASDVVNLAGLLYAALVGRWPGTVGSTIPVAPTEHGRPLRPRRVRAGVPRPLDAICEQVLNGELHPHAAPIDTALEIRAALSDFLGDPAGTSAWEPPGNEATSVLDRSSLLAGGGPAPAEADLAPGAQGDNDPEATQAGAPLFLDDDVSTRSSTGTSAAPSSGRSSTGSTGSTSSSRAPRSRPVLPGTPPEQREESQASEPSQRPLFADGRAAATTGSARGSSSAGSSRGGYPGNGYARGYSGSNRGGSPESHREDYRGNSPGNSPGTYRDSSPSDYSGNSPSHYSGHSSGNASGKPSSNRSGNTSIRSAPRGGSSTNGAFTGASFTGSQRSVGAGNGSVPPVWGPDADRPADEDRPHLDPDGPDDDRPGRSWLRLAVVLAVLLIVVVGTVIALNLGRGPADDPTPVTSSSGSRSAKATASVPVPIAGVRDFDPEGTPLPEENPGQVDLAVDGKPGTAWTTVTYRRTPKLGGLKSGVGLLVDLGKKTRVGDVRLTLGGSPTSLQILAAPAATSAPTSTDGLTKVASETDAGTRVDLRLEKAVSTRWLVVWLTELPPVAGGFQGRVAEISVRS